MTSPLAFPLRIHVELARRARGVDRRGPARWRAAHVAGRADGPCARCEDWRLADGTDPANAGREQAAREAIQQGVG